MENQTMANLSLPRSAVRKRTIQPATASTGGFARIHQEFDDPLLFFPSSESVGIVQKWAVVWVHGLSNSQSHSF